MKQKSEMKIAFDKQLSELKAAQKDARKQFKAAIDKAYAEQREKMKALRKQKADLWAEFKSKRAVETAAKKEADTKAAAERAAKKAAKKTPVINADEVIAKGEAALKKFAAKAQAKIDESK